MPRTDVLDQILACAAHELRPIVEKTQVAPELVSLGEMEGRILQALWRIGAFALGLLCGLGSGRRKKYVAGHTSVGQGRHRLPFKGTPKKTLLTIFGRIAFSAVAVGPPSSPTTTDGSATRWRLESDSDSGRSLNAGTQEPRKTVRILRGTREDTLDLE